MTSVIPVFVAIDFSFAAAACLPADSVQVPKPVKVVVSIDLRGSEDNFFESVPASEGLRDLLTQFLSPASALTWLEGETIDNYLEHEMSLPNSMQKPKKS